MVDKFLIRKTNTPIAWLLDLRAYDINIARNITTIN